VGTVVYVLVEVRPSWKRQNWQGLLWRLKSPREKIRLREAWLLDSPTQTNRLRLVDELVAVGNYERAANVLEEGLRGPFASDAELLLRLADCQLELGRGEAAAASLARMDEVRARDLVLRKQTTQARVSAATGDLTAAEKLFQDLQRQDHTEAPRYYFGQFLIRTGRTAEGKQVLRDLITRYRRGTTVWRMQEKTWFQAAHRLLRATR
jgi:hypothetical protein